MLYVYLLVAIVIVGLLFFMMSTANVSEIMKTCSSKAVMDAKQNHNIDLDMTKGSLEQVNIIIDKLSYQEGKDVKELSMMYGGYIGEIIMTLVDNAVWEKNHPKMGRNSYPIKLAKDNYAFPVLWVVKHLENGDDDNVMHQFIAWKHSQDI